MSEHLEEILSAYATPPELEFVTFAADNMDYNVRTLDGQTTFLGIGLIVIVTNIGTFALEPPVRLLPKN